MEGLKRTLAMFAITIGVLYVLGILYDLIWNGVFHPVQIVVVLLVLYAIVQLDRLYVRSYWQSKLGWDRRIERDDEDRA